MGSLEKQTGSMRSPEKSGQKSRWTEIYGSIPLDCEVQKPRTGFCSVADPSIRIEGSRGGV